MHVPLELVCHERKITQPPGFAWRPASATTYPGFEALPVPAKQRSLRRKTVVSSEPYETIQQLPSPEQAMASFEHTPPNDQDFQLHTWLRLRNTITYQLCLICLVPQAFTQAGCSNHSRVFPRFATLGNRLAVRTTMETDAVAYQAGYRAEADNINDCYPAGWISSGVSLRPCPFEWELKLDRCIEKCFPVVANGMINSSSIAITPYIPVVVNLQTGCTRLSFSWVCRRIDSELHQMSLTTITCPASLTKRDIAGSRPQAFLGTLKSDHANIKPPRTRALKSHKSILLGKSASKKWLDTSHFLHMRCDKSCIPYWKYRMNQRARIRGTGGDNGKRDIDWRKKKCGTADVEKVEQCDLRNSPSDLLDGGPLDSSWCETLAMVRGDLERGEGRQAEKPNASSHGVKTTRDQHMNGGVRATRTRGGAVSETVTANSFWARRPRIKLEAANGKLSRSAGQTQKCGKSRKHRIITLYSMLLRSTVAGTLTDGKPSQQKARTHLKCLLWLNLAASSLYYGEMPALLRVSQSSPHLHQTRDGFVSPTGFVDQQAPAELLMVLAHLIELRRTVQSWRLDAWAETRGELIYSGRSRLQGPVGPQSGTALSKLYLILG
ncbi:uncharacterized protein CLUP02_13536 [Colletotrichum lupini]|uniref:Uncharacterized protein n=1 Tax=Colletotrichum lupini TaxID=145971 RepID=A0A9Q8WLR9_9PEZI|nr:uncharacterized protein CLUP02_13536 [Colletotrichum lupini]UQC88014.1 hypothetical protein CLUP02_13536 [Colletotrichum lupini]